MNAFFPPDPKTRVAVVHPGVQYAPRLAQQLARVGMLSEYWTGVGVSDRGWLGPWVRRGAGNMLARFLSRRVIRDVPARQIHSRPWHEVLAACRKRLGQDEQGVLHRRNAAFQRALPGSVFARNDVVVGFDTSGWILARRCAAAGAAFVLDQSIAHPLEKTKIYGEVRRQYPDWAEGLEERLPEVLAGEAAEHRQANRIVVASAFTERTLIEHGVERDRIVINPYGVDLAAFTPRPDSRGDRPMRFVFVGQVGARKGIPLLLEAWAGLETKDAELWIVGHVDARFRPLLSGHRNVVFKGATSHLLLASLLRECDVFVFPSYYEGFGLVLLEAMACGLPVIATDATAAPDLVTDGQEGFVIQAGDKAALQRRLQWFVQDPSRAQPLGRAARLTAERFSWTAYGDRWAGLIRDLVRERAPSMREAKPCSQS